MSQLKRPFMKPLDVLVELVGWHTPGMDRMIELTGQMHPSGGGSLTGNFWRWCLQQGFQGEKAGTLGMNVSHGWYLCSKDKRKFRSWLKAELKRQKIEMLKNDRRTKDITAAVV